LVVGDSVQIARVDANNAKIANEYTPMAASAGATLLTVVEAIKPDTPASGAIRINGYPYDYAAIDFVGRTFTGLTPALVSNVLAAHDVYVPLLERIATGTVETVTYFSEGAISARLDVRRGVAPNPIIPTPVSINISAVGGSFSAIRSPDI